MRWTLVLFLFAVPTFAQDKKLDAPPKRTPAESMKLFQVPADLRWDQVLAEPVVKQPVSLSFDERGRMWVVQYRQYPFPAGLKILSRDKYWRVVYDKVPPPPPNHFPGKDQVTIHEDTDGDGIYDKHDVFIDNLNIATAAVRGRGGVWILNPPYLLFYPTANNADKPTGPPVVHLQGFGMEDCHSVVNSLRFGPDGWLYAAQGSTVSANVTRPGTKDKPIQIVGQHIWRYHPEKKLFEVFAEGGGNAFGVEIDARGRVFSGHNGGDTRGFHYVQGGAYRKGFEKHGILSNPYSFGFFEAIAHAKVQRFTHTFVINESPHLPATYRDKLIAVAPLQSHLMLTEVLPDRSSVKTKDVGPLVSSSDPWFRPVDIKAGPGGVYVADFYEEKIAHLRHYEGQIDVDTGRIYRLAAKDAKPTKPIDLNKKTSRELVDLLSSDDRWLRQTVIRVLGDRRDGEIVPHLRERLAKAEGWLGLEYLWALHQSGGWNDEAVKLGLNHSEPWVRAWTARLQGDEGKVSGPVLAELQHIARIEKHVIVRSQLAATARRLPPIESLLILGELVAHDEDQDDIHVPLLIWWGVEKQSGTIATLLPAASSEPAIWQRRLMRETILPRLMRRYAQAGSQQDYQTCVYLFKLAPDKASGLVLLKGFEEAFKGRSSAGLPRELVAEIAKLGGGSLSFAIRQGQNEAIAKALEAITDPKGALSERVELIEVLGEAKQKSATPVLLTLLDDREPEAVRKSALSALQSFSDPKIGEQVVERYRKWTGELREVAETLLSSRKEWTKAWLQAVEMGKLEAKDVPRFTIQQLLLRGDEEITGLVRKHWGDLRGATTEEMRKEVDRVLIVVASSGGDPLPGKKMFQTRCASCHTLHGQGGTVGPDLTTFKRDDLANLLVHVVNPSAEIREGYETQVVVTESGRALTGIVVEKDNRIVVMRAADGQKIVLPRDEIEVMRVAGMSLMPEGLLQGLNDGELRDLFAYLRTSQPINYK